MWPLIENAWLILILLPFMNSFFKTWVNNKNSTALYSSARRWIKMEPLRDALHQAFASVDSSSKRGGKVGTGKDIRSFPSMRAEGTWREFTVFLELALTLGSLLRQKVAATLSSKENVMATMGIPAVALLATLYTANVLGISIFFPFSEERNKVFFDGHGYRQIALKLRRNGLGVWLWRSQDDNSRSLDESSSVSGGASFESNDLFTNTGKPLGSVSKRVDGLQPEQPSGILGAHAPRLGV